MASWAGIEMKAYNKLIAIIEANRMLDIRLLKISFKSHVIKVV